MTGTGAASPTVAIVGAGAIGRGWAALCVSAGWACTLIDSDTRATDRAPEEIARRARALVAMGRAPSHTVEEGLARIRMGRSLLHACGDADWVIESIPEDLHAKQHVFENLGQV